jgi:hypothetical protein
LVISWFTEFNTLKQSFLFNAEKEKFNSENQKILVAVLVAVFLLQKIYLPETPHTTPSKIKHFSL